MRAYSLLGRENASSHVSQQESVLLSQLVDPLSQVEVLLQPGDTLAVEREDLQGRDRV